MLFLCLSCFFWCLSLCLQVSFSICFIVYLFLCLFAALSLITMSLFLPISLFSISLSPITLSICFFFSLSLFLYALFSFCLFFSLPLFLSVSFSPSLFLFISISLFLSVATVCTYNCIFSVFLTLKICQPKSMFFYLSAFQWQQCLLNSVSLCPSVLLSHAVSVGQNTVLLGLLAQQQ